MSARDAAIAVLVMFIWGSNITAAKAGTFQFPPLFLLALRLGLVALLLGWLIRPPFAQWRKLAAIALTMGVLHFGLLIVAVTRIDAGAAAIAMQTSVPFASALAFALWGERLGWRGAAGIALAFGGIVMMVGEPRVADNLGMLALVLVSAFFFAIANLQIKRLHGVDPLTLNAWIAALAAPAALLASLIMETGQWQAVQQADWAGWGSVVYMAVVVSILGHSLWYRLLPRYPVNQTMPFNLLIPVFGVGCGIAILGESLTWPIAIGGVLVIGGVALILLRRAPRGAPAAAE